MQTKTGTKKTQSQTTNKNTNSVKYSNPQPLDQRNQEFLNDQVQAKFQARQQQCKHPTHPNSQIEETESKKNEDNEFEVSQFN